MTHVPKFKILFLIMIAGKTLFAQSTRPDSLTQSISPIQVQVKKADKSRGNVIKINPLSLAMGHLSLFYERSLTKHTTLSAGYNMGGTVYNFGTRLEAGGAVYRRATLEVRHYWGTKQMTGFYVGPYLRLNQLTVSQFIYDQQENALKDSSGNRLNFNRQAYIWSPGVLAGMQMIVRRFCLDGFLGVQRQLLADSSLGSNQLVESMTADWSVRIGLSLGIAF